MLEVTYYTESFFDLTIDSGAYHTIRRFSDGDPASAEYFDSQLQLGRELEDYLRLVYKHRVSVQDEDVEADYWAVDTDTETFSDQMIKYIIEFLRENSTLYSVIVCIYEYSEIIGAPYLGRVIVTLNRIGVTLQIKGIFESKCRNSLLRYETSLVFHERS